MFLYEYVKKSRCQYPKPIPTGWYISEVLYNSKCFCLHLLMRRLLFLLYLLLVLFDRTALHAQPVVDISTPAQQKTGNITHQVWWLKDVDNTGIETLAHLPAQEWQTNAGSQTFNKGVTPYAYWITFKLTVSNAATNAYYLHLSNRGMNYTALYAQKKDQLISLGTAGDHLPFANRPYSSTSFIYPLQIGTGDTITYFLYCSKKNENLNLKLSVYTEKKLKATEQQSYLYIGLFTGILVMAFIVSLILLIIFRDQLNFWYAVYIVFVVNMLFVYEGLDFQFFYPRAPFFAGVSRYIASSLILGMMMHVMQLFCNQTRYNSRFFVAVQYMKYAIFLMVPLTLFCYGYDAGLTIKRFHFILFLLQQTLGVLLVIISCIEKIVQQYKPAIFYLTAVLLLLYSGVSAIFLELGYINRSTETPNLLQISFVLEVILISAGVLYKYDLLKKQNQELSVELTEMKLSSIKKTLQTRHKEQLRIAEDLHDLMGAKLAAVKFKVARMEAGEPQKEEVMRLVDELSQSSRMIAHNIKPAELLQHDLSDVICSQLQELNHEQQIHFEFCQLGEPRTLNSALEITLYKIISELLTNIIRHSAATEATVQMNFKHHELELIVEDNGTGISSTRHQGMGLRNIRKRVEELEGQIHLDSRPGSTIFIFNFPYKV